MVLIRVGNQKKKIINNKVTVIEQKFVFDPVN